jgi:hypothetical protein
MTLSECREGLVNECADMHTKSKPIRPTFRIREIVLNTLCLSCHVSFKHAQGYQLSLAKTTMVGKSQRPVMYK